MTESRNKILITDDEEDVRDYLERIVRHLSDDAEIEHFEDMKSLESRLNKGVENVRLVITDNNTSSELRGCQLIVKYANRPEFERVLFILHYGGDSFYGEVATQNGAYASIPKVLDLSEKMRIIGNALTQARELLR